MLAVAGGGFECGEAGGEGDVEEGRGGEGEQGMVGVEEEGGEVGVAGGGEEGLEHWISEATAYDLKGRDLPGMVLQTCPRVV